MFQYFTVAQANQALPDVIEKFKTALAKKNRINAIERQLQASMSAGDKFEEYVELKQKLNIAVTQFYQSVEDLENTGAVLKGLDEGLLDFPSKRFDEEVWLCWKYGETEIKFWHEKDSGFMGRKPLEISDDALV